MSCLTSKVLEQFFNPQHDIRRDGVEIAGRCIKAEVGVILADGPAIKEMLACKGHAGTKPCPCCLDATLHNSKGIPLHQLCGQAVSIANTDFGAFQKHTDDSIRSTVRRVEEHHAKYVSGDMTKKEYELRSQMLGWNWCPDSIILNERFGLRIASSIMFDWAHVYLNDGLADSELGQCMKRLHTAKAAST